MKQEETMEQLTAVQARERIEREAKEKAVQEVRHIKSIEIGKVVRQGDIYIHRVADEHKHGKESKSRQLAIGNTQGSRHVAESPSKAFDGTTLPTYCDQRTFLGPLVQSKKRFTVTHPEHAHVSLPAGCYQITHQTDARTMGRVQD
jgi:hypothetical protein